MLSNFHILVVILVVTHLEGDFGGNVFGGHAGGWFYILMVTCRVVPHFVGHDGGGKSRRSGKKVGSRGGNIMMR